MVAIARIVDGVAMRVVPVPCLSDNYAYLVIDDETGLAAIVDPGEAAPIVDAVAREGVKLAAVWATHHHPDHVGGVRALADANPGLEVVAHFSDRERVPAVTRAVDDGDEVELGGLRARIMHNPGHTLGAISFIVADDHGVERAMFTGDTLFAAGCGRVFEGTPAMMFDSLSRLADEAPALEVYFGHEYTVANLRFAAAVSPDDPAVKARAADAAAKRAAGQPTTPSTIALERATNPFLRGKVKAIAAAAYAQDDTVDVEIPASVFRALRAWKDRFK
jgi:hydroxyacylglutathione hydrolase